MIFDPPLSCPTAADLADPLAALARAGELRTYLNATRSRDATRLAREFGEAETVPPAPRRARRVTARPSMRVNLLRVA